MSYAAHPGEPDTVHYPEGDGEPLAETEVHVEELLTLRQTLKMHFEDAAEVYVGANMFVYYEKGYPKGVFAPDVFVARGVEKRVRRTYKLWEEGGVPPAFVAEISSTSTWLEDTGNNEALCARLGVREYFLFDPCGDYLVPRLQGFRLRDGDYERIEPRPDGRVRSDVLGLELHADGTMLRCIDPRTGRRLMRFGR